MIPVIVVNVILSMFVFAVAVLHLAKAIGPRRAPGLAFRRSPSTAGRPAHGRTGEPRPPIGGPRGRNRRLGTA
jgi:hypothetical protein